MTPPILPKIVNCVVEAKDNGALTMAAGIDTKGFDFARFIILTGTTHVDAVVDPTIQECETVDGSYATITNATHDVLAADDNVTYVVDIALGGSRMRFLKPAWTTGNGTGTASECAILCELWRADSRLNTAVDSGLAAAADWVQL